MYCLDPGLRIALVCNSTLFDCYFCVHKLILPLTPVFFSFLNCKLFYMLSLSFEMTFFFPCELSFQIPSANQSCFFLGLFHRLTSRVSLSWVHYSVNHSCLSWVHSSVNHSCLSFLGSFFG